MRTIAELSDGVAGLLQATNLDNVTNLFGAYERGARTLAQKADVPEASGRQNYMVYDRVFDYLAPETIFGGAIVDFRPQGVSRSPMDAVYKKFIKPFDETKCFLPSGVNIAFEFQKGVGIMRVAQTRATPAVLLDRMDDSTKWTAGGSASDLATDSTVYYEAPAGLRFNLTGASSGYIERTLDNSIDLTDYDGVGVIFLAIDTPSSTDLSSIEVRLGSSSSAYSSLTKTEGFLGAWQADKYLLVAFDLAAASKTGTPNFAAIDYIRVTMTHGATITNMRLGEIFIALPSPFEMIFQSSAIFLRASDNTLAVKIQSVNDQIVLNEAAYNIFEHECAYTIAFQNGGNLSEGVLKVLNETLHGIRGRNGAVVQLGLYDMYRADNPSQEIRSMGTYYDDDN